MLEQPADLRAWVQRGAVEVLAEIGRTERDGYAADSLFVDMDGRNGYSLNALKRLAAEIARRFAANEWVDPAKVYLYWTGGKGFPVVAIFREGIFRPLELVDRTLRTILARLCNDVDIFLSDQPVLYSPYVVLDLSPVKDRGVHRNAFSLHAGTGNVCIPVDLTRLAAFDPEVEAAVDTVSAVLENVEVGPQPFQYASLIANWFSSARSSLRAAKYSR